LYCCITYLLFIHLFYLFLAHRSLDRHVVRGAIVMRPPTVSRDVLVQRLCVTTLGLTTLVLVAACTRTTRTIILAPTPEAETAGPSTAATLGVPPGHLPKPGECRVWIPRVPPGRQPR